LFFRQGLNFLLGPTLDLDPPVSISQVAGITGTQHHTQLPCLLHYLQLPLFQPLPLLAHSKNIRFFTN
jgi:hypothetical protein